jgi:hypothetical protein
MSIILMAEIMIGKNMESLSAEEIIQPEESDI